MKLKRIFTLLFILFFVFSVCNAFAAGKIRGFKNQTGGTANDLDSISVGDLADGDVGFVFSSSYDYFYVYVFNATATNSESSPTYIRPDDYSTQGVWYLTTLSGVTFSSVTIGGFDASIVPQTDGSGNLESSTVPSSHLTYIEPAAGANPTTSSAGQMVVDTDDDFIEFYSSASRAVGALISETFSIVEPDTIQGITDDVVLKHFMADAYPHGVTIKDIAISASSAYTSETFLIEEWDDRAGSTQTTVESITISSQYQEDDGTLSDASIAADAFLVVNLDDTPEDIAEVEITVTYYINPGD